MSRAHAHPNRRQWARFRRAVFERDGYRCRACGRPGALECDHVVPLHRGGAMWELDNAQALCRSCHIEKTRRENRRELTQEESAWNVLVAELLEFDP